MPGNKNDPSKSTHTSKLPLRGEGEVNDVTAKESTSTIADKYHHGKSLLGQVQHWPKDKFSVRDDGSVVENISEVVVGMADPSVLTPAAIDALNQLEGSGWLADAGEGTGTPIVSETAVTAAARQMLDEARAAGQPAPDLATTLLASAEGEEQSSDAAGATAAPTAEETLAAAAAASTQASNNSEKTMSSSNTKSTASSTDTKHAGFWTAIGKTLFWTLLMIAILVAVIFGTQWAAAYITALELGEVLSAVLLVVLAAIAIVTEVVTIRFFAARAEAALSSHFGSNFERAVAAAAAA